MLSRWRRRNTQRSIVRKPNSLATPSLLERKIHPDLNSLAEELASSQGHGHDSEDRASGIESLGLGTTGFGGLRPSARSRSSQKEAYSKDKDNTGLRANQNRPREAESKQIEAYTNPLHQNQKEALQESIAHSNPSYFTVPTRPGDQPAGSSAKTSSIMRWSTFGRRPRPRPSDADIRVRRASSSTAQSSLSQSQSLVTGPSAFPPSDSDHPPTPVSPTHSFYTSTPQSRSSSFRNPARDRDVPSPHTFGMPTPPRSDSKHDDSYFTFKENPPPLPPLDHPAFRNASKAIGLSSHKQPFHDVDEHGKFTRHAHSLPSLKLTRSRSTTRTGSTKSPAKWKNTRPRSKSSSGTGNSDDKDDQIFSEAAMNRRTHSRNQSKSSIASSRRSSAEYSAKQASSIGHEHERVHDGCWEVQVSKEMVRLALGVEQVQRDRVKVETTTRRQNLTQNARASSLGQARGKNRRSGEESRLGSPFLLQDTSHNLTDKQGSNDITARYKSNTRRSHPSTVPPQNLRYDVMAYGDSTIIPPTGSSATNTTRRARESSVGDSPSPSGSQSRRGGARATSTPSRTRTPSPPPAQLVFGSMQAPSTLLAPPSLSITSPTPEASPVSPSRRTHHKSSPTIPTTSVLKTPSTPPVIEKSYSSGSGNGKRKADEAGVGGDKTPPKEPRETRATFAPEPRTHRASGTSGSSGHAPSSFNRSKRVRLTDTSEGKSSTRSASHASTLPTPDDSPPNAKSIGSWSSRGSHGPVSASSHTNGGPPPAPSASHASHYQQQPPHRPSSRRSLSQASIPLSALISPHAPSISRSGTFHMRDPRKPSPVQSTPWTLSFPSHVQEGEPRWTWRGWVERGGSPLHAWLFFIGFILFPLWWAAALLIPIPKTRHLGGTDAEKAVVLDDPQVEHDAKSWRTRCRVMAVVSLVTYIPFIVLVAIFA